MYIKHIFSALLKNSKALESTLTSVYLNKIQVCMFFRLVSFKQQLHVEIVICVLVESLVCCVPWYTVTFVLKGFNMLKAFCTTGCAGKLRLFPIVESVRDKLDPMRMGTDAVTISIK